MRTRSTVLTAITILFIGAGAGCGETSGERLQMIDKAMEIMERHNVAYSGSITLGGRPSVGASTDFYLDSSIVGQFNVHGNAANARLGPEPLPMNEVTPDVDGVVDEQATNDMR